MHNLSRSSLRLHEAVELRQQRFIANNGRRRRDVCLGLPERENVPGHLIGQTRDGGEQGVGFGAAAERDCPGLSGTVWDPRDPGGAPEESTDYSD